MLNNYLHDLAVAVLFVSIMTELHLRRAVPRRGEAGAASQGQGEPLPYRDAFVSACTLLRRIACISLVVTLAGGAVRTAAFRRYEWMEAAGRDQVGVLVVKHVILAALVAAAVAGYVRLRSGRRAAGKKEER